MFIPDVPVAPDQYPPIIFAEATASRGTTISKTLTAGVCFPVQNIEEVPLSLAHDISPAGTALNALFAFQKDFSIKAKDTYRSWIETAKITLLESPTKGKITRTIPAFPTPDNDSYYYNPKPGHMSKDRVVYQVEMGGYTVKLIYTFHPTENGGGPESDKLYCGNRGTLYRIVDEAKTRSGLDPAILAERIGLTFGNAVLPGLTIQTADLPGASVGEATGTTITLDTTAAGYGWFIDSTPTDNAEFLPTSNPNEWIAKSGSDAAGKMDLLTVLLHEYGHALGLEHNP